MFTVEFPDSMARLMSGVVQQLRGASERLMFAEVKLWHKDQKDDGLRG